MNREDIIRMAQEAGWKDLRNYDFEMNEFLVMGGFKDLERFAALVAFAEREACADLCDRFANRMMSAEECADAIRARGQA